MSKVEQNGFSELCKNTKLVCFCFFIRGQSLPSGDLLFCKVIDYLVQLELKRFAVKQTSRRSDLFFGFTKSVVT